MRKIIFKWIGISFAVSLIPLFLLGANQGGVALGPFIIILGLIVGFIGAAIHSSIYVFKSGNKNKIIASICFSVFSMWFIGWIIISSGQCVHNSEYAKERVVKYINSKNDLELSYLGKQKISDESCHSKFKYTDPDNEFIFIVSEFGKLHFSR